MSTGSLNWLGIARLGLVQSAIGAIVVLTTSTFSRVMVVEMALPASLQAALGPRVRFRSTPHARDPRRIGPSTLAQCAQ